MGFCWRSLGTFCRYWQKVTRRRQKTLCEKETRRRHKNKKLLEKQAAGDSKEKLQRVLRIATGASHPRNDITKRK